MDKPTRNSLVQANFQTNLIAGLLTIIPLVAVWLVFDFFLETLSNAGRPLADAFAQAIEQQFPDMTPILENGQVQWVIALLVTLLALYIIGAVTSRVIGQQLWGYIEAAINRIPLANTIYS
ncbi:MAG: DUF502 domain-containing protein, partial [Rhizomicrobium sp.]